MALDPKTLKELNNVIKVLAGTGKEISSKARELMTFIYAVREGFINIEGSLKDALEKIPEGAMELPNLRKYLKSLQLSDDIIEDILEKRKELDKLDDDRIRSAKNYYKLLDLIYGLEEDRFNLTTRAVTAFDELNDQLINQQRLIKSIGLSSGLNADALNDQIKKHREINKIFVNEYLSADDVGKQLETIDDMIDNISSNKMNIGGVNISTKDAIDKYTKISKKQIDLINIEDEIRRKKLSQFIAYASGKSLNLNTGELFDSEGVKIVGKGFESLSGHIKSVANQFEDLISTVGKTGVTDEVNSAIESIVQKISSSRRLSEAQTKDLKQLTTEIIEQAAAQKSENDQSLKTLMTSKERLIILSKYAPVLRSASSAADSLAESVQGFLDVIPAGLQKFLGIDDTMESIKKSSEESISAFKSKLLETGKVSDAIGAGFKKWGSGISTSVGLVGSLVLVLGAAYKLTRMLDEANKEVAERMGISLLQARKLNRANLDLVASQKNQFLVLEDIRGVQEAYIKSTGQVFDMTSEHGQHAAQDIAEIGKAFGYGSERAVELNETFSQLGASEEFSTSLQRQLGFMTEMTGLSPDIVSKDLLDSADILSTYFAGMPEEAARTVLQVRRMGLSLRKAGDIAKSMLDLEGFMTDMFELAAMNGPDLSKAFDLGIRGDIEGMTESIMDSIGSLEQFGQMDFLQREKLARTLGMSTDEISKSLMLREKMVGLDKTEAAALEANLDRMGNIQDMNQDAIRARLSELQSTDRLSNAWGRIKAVLIRAVLPIAEAFAKTLEDSGPIIDSIVGGFKVLGVVIKGVAWFVSGMMIPLQLIGKIVGWIYTGVEKIVSAFGHAEHGVKGVHDEMASTGSIVESLIKSVGALVGVWMLGGKQIFKWATSAKTGLEGVTDVATKASGKGGVLGNLTKWLFGSASPKAQLDDVVGGVKDVAGKVAGDTTDKGVIGTVKDVLTGGNAEKLQEKVSGAPSGDAIGGQQSKKLTTWGDRISGQIKSIGKTIRTGMNEVYSVVKSGAKIIIDGFKTLLDGFTTIAVKLVDLVMKPLQKLATGVGNVLKTLLTSVGDGLESFGPKALIGAAAMVVVAGALYVTAKAVQQFTGANWGDLAKAGVALVGLTAVAALLGALSGELIVGAVALGIMGAALIPTAYALGLFAAVKWEDLAKAGVAILGLSAAVGVLGGIMMSGVGAAVILAGAAALAVMGASLMPLAISVKKLSDSNLSGVSEGLKKMGSSISDMDAIKISTDDNSPLSVLRELADIADPLNIATRSISMLGESITRLSDALANADLTKLSQFEKMKGMFGSLGVSVPMRGEATTGVAQNPSPESTAQNVFIRESASTSKDAAQTSMDEQIRQGLYDSSSSNGSKRMEQLLAQLISEVQGINKRPMYVMFDDGTLKSLNYKIKGMNNNR